MLEPCEGKPSCTVLRGEGGSNTADLPDQPALTQGEPDRLLGYEVYTSPYAPTDAIAFGDYKYYNIGDRGTRSFKQLTELFAGNGMIGFVAKERVDGKLVLAEAVQILKVKAAAKAAKA